MAKKKNEREDGAQSNLTESSVVPGPKNTPEPGATVKYRFSEAHPTRPNEIVDAKVEFVHPNTDGRLLNVSIATAEGSESITCTPFRPAEDELGNTWHEPE